MSSLSFGLSAVCGNPNTIKTTTTAIPSHMYLTSHTVCSKIHELIGLKLCQALHPEDTEATEDDLTDVTIQNVLTDELYNDLGFRNGDRMMILVESQSTWSVNIIIRVLLYLAQA